MKNNSHRQTRGEKGSRMWKTTQDMYSKSEIQTIDYKQKTSGWFWIVEWNPELGYLNGMDKFNYGK